MKNSKIILSVSDDDIEKINQAMESEQKQSILEAFQSPDGLTEHLDQVAFEVNNFKHNLETKAGRAETASFARKVAKLKIRLDDMGKDLVSGWKSKSKLVDSSRKSMRERLDELRDLARKPLTDFETAEAARVIKQLEEQKAKEESEKLELDHEFAILMNDDFDRKAESVKWALEEAKKQDAEKARVQQEIRDKEIATQAAAEAMQRVEDAEKLAAQEKIDKEAAIRQAVIDKVEAEERAEQQRVTAFNLAEQQRKESEQAAIEAKKQAEESEKRAVERVKMDAERAESEKVAKYEAERMATLKDKKHVAKVDSEIVDQLVWDATISEAKAKSVLKAIKAGKIKGLAVIY